MKVLVKPILTEKASSTNEKGIFVFMVDKNANKNEWQLKIKINMERE